MKRLNGFTLFELIITLAIVSILAIVAVSSYSNYVLRGRRSDGINTLLAMSLAEERYRLSNTQYGTLAQAWNSITASPEGYYTLSISNVSATGYTLTATASGNQVNDKSNGIACSTLTLTVSNGTVTKAPSACWPS